ncbi:MAG: 3-hydroxybutyryl-CoA dehydrogenase, partial [uncultured Rubrobacteraceae bacterium]
GRGRGPERHPDRRRSGRRYDGRRHRPARRPDRPSSSRLRPLRRSSRKGPTLRPRRPLALCGERRLLGGGGGGALRTHPLDGEPRGHGRGRRGHRGNRREGRTEEGSLRRPRRGPGARSPSPLQHLLHLHHRPRLRHKEARQGLRDALLHPSARQGGGRGAARPPHERRDRREGESPHNLLREAAGRPEEGRTRFRGESFPDADAHRGGAAVGGGGREQGGDRPA